MRFNISTATHVGIAALKTDAVSMLYPDEDWKSTVTKM